MGLGGSKGLPVTVGSASGGGGGSGSGSGSGSDSAGFSIIFTQDVLDRWTEIAEERLKEQEGGDSARLSEAEGAYHHPGDAYQIGGSDDGDKNVLVLGVGGGEEAEMKLPQSAMEASSGRGDMDMTSFNKAQKLRDNVDRFFEHGIRQERQFSEQERRETLTAFLERQRVKHQEEKKRKEAEESVPWKMKEFIQIGSFVTSDENKDSGVSVPNISGFQVALDSDPSSITASPAERLNKKVEAYKEQIYSAEKNNDEFEKELRKLIGEKDEDEETVEETKTRLGAQMDKYLVQRMAIVTKELLNKDKEQGWEHDLHKKVDQASKELRSNLNSLLERADKIKEVLGLDPTKGMSDPILPSFNEVSNCYKNNEGKVFNCLGLVKAYNRLVRKIQQNQANGK